MQKIKSLLLKLTYTIIILACVTGCSDTPYIGSTDSMLTPADIDKYLVSPDGETLCLQSGYDSICLTLYPKGKDSTSPIVHIYPSRIRYVFSYEGRTILQAEKIRDNTDIISDLPPKDGGPVPIVDTPGDGGSPPTSGNPPTNGNPPTSGNPPTNGNPPTSGNPPTNGNPATSGNPPDDSPPNTITSHYVFSNPPNTLRGDEWIVWIYYPDDYSGPRGLPNSLEGYGFTITVDGGEATEFAQVTGGERGSGVRLVIRTILPEVLVTITWNPPHTNRSATFTLKSDINLSDYTP